MVPKTPQDDLRKIAYVNRCRIYHAGTNALLILTRDVGHHSSGWFKNPDWERCWHLSISFWVNNVSQPHDRMSALKWVEAIFTTEERKYLWIESPFSEQGKAADVYHYRVFCDRGWRPIKPRGEVYDKTNTPADWLSWSDARAKEAKYP